jgi:hypothetical protein
MPRRYPTKTGTYADLMRGRYTYPPHLRRRAQKLRAFARAQLQERRDALLVEPQVVKVPPAAPLPVRPQEKPDRGHAWFFLACWCLGSCWFGLMFYLLYVRGH